jgi:hypothetical protein
MLSKMKALVMKKLVMKNQPQAVSAGISSELSADTLESKTLGINPTQYYRPEPRLGFTPFAELWNGRLAMVGIIIALAFELISNHAF